MDNIKNKKGLSITLVFNASSLNYGEGIGNISEMEVFIHMFLDKH